MVLTDINKRGYQFDFNVCMYVLFVDLTLFEYGSRLSLSSVCLKCCKGIH